MFVECVCIYALMEGIKSKDKTEAGRMKPKNQKLRMEKVLWLFLRPEKGNKEPAEGR
jgi:hypothetical protein